MHPLKGCTGWVYVLIYPPSCLPFLRWFTLKNRGKNAEIFPVSQVHQVDWSWTPKVQEIIPPTRPRWTPKSLKSSACWALCYGNLLRETPPKKKGSADFFVWKSEMMKNSKSCEASGHWPTMTSAQLKMLGNLVDHLLSSWRPPPKKEIRKRIKKYRLIGGFNPSLNILVKFDHFPKDQDENKRFIC